MFKSKPDRRSIIGKYNRDSANDAGFTLVELLVVIVVIAILAAISIVAYNGIQTRATESILQSDLKNAATQLGILNAAEGSYPSGDITPEEVESVKSDGTAFQYSSPDGAGYCLTATSTKSGKARAFHIQSGSAAAEGPCSGHSGPSADNGGSDVAATMQDFSTYDCSNLDTYDGTNQSAVIRLRDARADEQTYEVAKLADGNCWMLNNLKLGGSNPITLTSSNSDVNSDFILPALTTTGSNDHVDPSPRLYGPVPGATESGKTNYGYLYNWPAATAGETRNSIGIGATAQQSICPSGGWRLPATKGGDGEFAKLEHHLSTPQDWLHGGPFNGVLAGGFVPSGHPEMPAEMTGFMFQGDLLQIWTGSTVDNAYGDYRSDALVASFGADEYNVPNDSGHSDSPRSFGFSVRCLLEATNNASGPE